MEQNETPQENTWHINITMPDYSPRKVTAKELAEHEAKREEVIRVRLVLLKMNRLIKTNKLPLYQSEGDSDVGFTPAIHISDYSTEIDNETGLLYLPAIPEKWDENTIVQHQIPGMGYNGGAVYTMAIVDRLNL